MSHVEEDAEISREREPMVVSPEHVAWIEATIAAARPHVQADGGDLELVAIEDDIVRVALSGACSHCGSAGQTLGALRRHIAQATGLPLRVLPARD
jgi:Fe-S cluster biogenesis protein NfuA